MKTNTNKVACITGATSGIGAAFAEEFAKRGYHLIITGRRMKKINRFAKRLTKSCGITVDVIEADFTNEKTINQFAKKISRLSNLEILINNAGYGSEGNFCEEKSEDQHAKLKVSSSTTIKLCHAVIPNMVKNGTGTIINVSSLSACFPVPGAAMYSATRAFLVTFTESLYLELKDTEVKVQVLCPGTTKTDFHQKLGFDPEDYYQGKGLLKILSAKEVVETSIKDLKRGKVISIPGKFNRFSWLVFKLIPRKLTYKIVQQMIEKRQSFKRNGNSKPKFITSHLNLI